jgi:hypothetical protein
MAFRFFQAVLLIVLVAGCSESTAPLSALPGTYTATIFRVTPDGQSAIDALAGGGSLTISIAEDLTTDGVLHLPDAVSELGDFSASMAGTATVDGSVVKFVQPADSFVRDLEWSRRSSALEVSEQTAGAATFTIRLTRQ